MFKSVLSFDAGFQFYYLLRPQFSCLVDVLCINDGASFHYVMHTAVFINHITMKFYKECHWLDQRASAYYILRESAVNQNASRRLSTLCTRTVSN